MQNPILSHIIARRTTSFWSDEYGWAVRRSYADADGYQMSDTEKERLALLALLEPGEGVDGVGYRGHLSDFFYVAPDAKPDLKFET